MKAPDISFSQVIPALPGYNVVSVLGGSNDFPTTVHRDPVIAWALEVDIHSPYPVTLEGVQLQYAAIERPDGQVDEVCSAWYPDAAAWLASQQDHYADARDVDAQKLATLRGQSLADNAAAIAEPC
jgi:hypothetical protein